MSTMFGSASFRSALVALFLVVVVEGQVDETEGMDMNWMRENGRYGCRCPPTSFGPDMLTGEFKSTNYPNYYCNNLDCQYEVEPAPGMAIVLIIESFSSELRHDYLSISQTFHLNNKSNIARMYRLSGEESNVSPRRIVTAEGNGLRLLFHTDGSENQWNGFRARFIRFNQTSQYIACPPIYYEAGITPMALPSMDRRLSFNGPECIFIINATGPTYSVLLQVLSVSPGCEMRVTETELLDSELHTPLLVSRSRSPLQETSSVNVTSRGASLTIHVSQQRPVMGNLYSAQFLRVESPCACVEGDITVPLDRAISVSSPGYPENYCDNLQCAWNLKGQSTSTDIGTHLALRVVFSAFSMERDVDKLTLSDTSTGVARALTRLTGTDGRGASLTFNTNQAQLLMETDISQVENGFNASVELIRRDNVCRCGDNRQPREYSEISANISFSMPSDKMGCNFVDCFWRISDPEQEAVFKKHRIMINIDYRLQRIGEFIHIENGVDFTNPERLVYNEHKRLVAAPPEPGRDSRREVIEYDAAGGVQIWFHSAWPWFEQASGDRRFELNYEWRPLCQCGEPRLFAIEGQWKRLTSPDYPKEYCHLLRCRYSFYADQGYRIVLNITDFYTEPNEDFVSIYDGLNISSPHLVLASGYKIWNSLVESTNNTMSLLFTSDASIARKGFSLLYSAKSIIANDEEEDERPESDGVAVDQDNNSKGKGLIVALIGLVLLGGVAIVLLLHRTGRISFGYRLDQLLGGGRESVAVGFTHTNNSSTTTNQRAGYQPL